jgi:phage baseplate assembly protein W
MAQQDPLIGVGFKFPIKVNAKGGLDWSDGPLRIQDAIWIILSTSPGERVMRPAFGAGAQDFVFESNSAVSRVRLAEEIQNALSKWEPRIELVAVDVTESKQGPNCVLASIQYRIRGTNELTNMVYPFYLHEGPG